MLTNIEIENFIKNGLISISPFNQSQLEVNHYRLNVNSIIKRGEGEDFGVRLNKISLENNMYAIQPNEYLIIEVKEKIILGKGMFGEFYPASLNIESGLILNCGWLNSFYERPIRFGLYNAGPIEIRLHDKFEIARVNIHYIGENTPIDYNREKTNEKYLKMLQEVRKTESEIKKLETELEQKKANYNKLKKDIDQN